MLTRKSFNRLAKEIASVRSEVTNLPSDEQPNAEYWIDKVMIAVGYALKEENPNFDWEKFIDASHEE